MFLKIKLKFCFIILMGLVLLTSCDHAIQRTIKDIAFANTSKYSLFAVTDPSGQLNKELTFTYKYIPSNDSTYLHLAPETNKGFIFDPWDARRYNSLHDVYVLPKNAV